MSLGRYDADLAREESDMHRAERVLFDLPDYDDMDEECRAAYDIGREGGREIAQAVHDAGLSARVLCLLCSHVTTVTIHAECGRCGSGQIRPLPYDRTSGQEAPHA